MQTRWIKASAFAAIAVGAGSVFNPAKAQFTFSIDYRSATIATPDSCPPLIPITEGDILSPATAGGVPAPGLLPPPCTFIPGGPGGVGLVLYPGCVGHPPGVPCGVEVDAHSFGTDGPWIPGMPPGRIAFSVDPMAAGIPGSPAPPSVWTENAPFPAEAAADVFVDLGLPACGPLPPFAVPPGNTAIVDGNGVAGPSPFAYVGTGLLEPIPPACGFVADPGDNLDSVDVDGPLGAALLFFSLDAAPGFPTCRATSGSAMAHGFPPGAVLVSGGGAPAMYAPPPVLGLDLFGPGTDDLDALALFENGIAGYQPSPAPCAYLGGPDMLFFSVRVGSAVIGAPDSVFGIPIEPGDVLIPPVAGGVSPFPGIMIAAENLGLATMRSGMGPIGDEMDALDVVRAVQFGDCNGNSVYDAVEIAMGAPDCNSNGVIDSCECAAPVNYCVGKVNSNGCTPSIAWIGPSVISASCAGAGSVANISVTQLSPRPGAAAHLGQLFYSTTGPAAIPFAGGTLCVKAPIKRIAPLVNTGGTVGSTTLCDSSVTQDFNARIASGVDPALIAGASVWCQGWARDTAAFAGVQLSDALSFVICP